MKRNPIFLLADSQVLFARMEDGRPFGARLRNLLPSPGAKTAYVGASNGDDEAFYSIFKAAMDVAAFAERRMIGTGWSGDDRRWLESSELILLAGGDVARGWRVFHESGTAIGRHPWPSVRARRLLPGNVTVAGHRKRNGRKTATASTSRRTWCVPVCEARKRNGWGK